MSAAPSEAPAERWRRRSGILHRRSAVLLVIGAGAFGMFDPPSERGGAPPEDRTYTRRYYPPVESSGGVQLGPSTLITKLP